MPATEHAPAKTPWWHLIGDLALLVAIRVLLRIAVLSVFGGDPNNDLHIFDYLAEHPTEHFLAEGRRNAYPQLLGFVLAPFHHLAGGDGSWLRGLLVLCECFIYLSLHRRWSAAKHWPWVRWSFLLGLWTAPLSSVWVQEELLAVAPLLALLMGQRSRTVTVLVAFVSVFVAKVFYIFALVAALLARPWGRVSLVCAAALGCCLALDRSGGFVPPNPFATTLWVLSDLDFATQKQLSGQLTLIVWLGLEWGFARRRVLLDFAQRYRLMMALFLIGFYHVNPEYYLFLTLPLMVAYLQGQVSGAHVTSGLVWFWSALAVNASYALLSRAPSAIWHHAHQAALWSCSLVGLWHLAVTLRPLLGRTTRLPVADDPTA